MDPTYTWDPQTVGLGLLVARLVFGALLEAVAQRAGAGGASLASWA